MQEELFSVYYVEANLRHSYDAVFADFLRFNSPKFDCFRKNRNQILVSGRGYDVSIFQCHVEYVRTLERTVKSLLDKIGVPQERFVNALSRCEDPPIKSLMWTLTRYQDFDSFAEMMEDHCNSTYIRGAAPAYHHETAVTASSSSSPSSSLHTQPQPQNTARKSVRVLWDLENVPCSKKMGGMRTVTALQGFLRSLHLVGPGIDARTTAFFGMGKINKSVIAELDKAAVELVWVSAKREDADRKLGTRIMQEMAVLQPSQTTIVIISSDQDFRSYVQQLTNSGFSAIVIHDVPENGNTATWRNALCMHASQSFKWSSIIDEFGPQTPTSPQLLAAFAAEDAALIAAGIRSGKSRSPSLASLDGEEADDGTAWEPESARRYAEQNEAGDLTYAGVLLGSQAGPASPQPQPQQQQHSQSKQRRKRGGAAGPSPASKDELQQQQQEEEGADPSEDGVATRAEEGGTDAESEEVSVHVQDLSGRWSRMEINRSVVCGQGKHGWVQAWRGAFGFISAPVKLDEAGEDRPPNQVVVRVYCHHSLLKSTPGRPLFLDKNQQVSMNIEYGDRGLYATALCLVSSSDPTAEA